MTGTPTTVRQGSFPAGFLAGGQVFVAHGHVPRLTRPLQKVVYAADSEIILTAARMDTFDEALNWAIVQVTGGPLYRYGPEGSTILIARWDTDRYLFHHFGGNEHETWEQAGRADTPRFRLLQRRMLLAQFLGLFTTGSQSVSEILRGPLPSNEVGDDVVGARHLALIHLWWDAQHDEGYPRETAWMLLRLMLPVPALAQLYLPTDGPPALVTGVAA